MSHHLESLSIINYKSCKDLNIKITNLTPIVGYNNAGKSNILSAIEWLFKKKLLTENDYNDKNNEISVTGKIVGITQEILDSLLEEHRDKISPYVVNGEVTIKRFQIINADKAADVKFHILNPTNGQFRSPPTGIDNAIKGLFPDPIRVGAMENSAEDSSKSKSTTTIGKLLIELCSSIQAHNIKRVSGHLDAISRRMSSEGNRRFTELNDIDSSISDKINDFFPGIKLKLHFQAPTFLDLFKDGSVRVYEDEMAGIARECSSYGHGTQRSVQMALIRHLAEIKKELSSTTTTLLLIDEPELYLHPFAIEQIREALDILSKHGYQILFTTHSAQMVTAETSPMTLLVRKNAVLGTHVRTTLSDAVTDTIQGAASQAAHLFSLTQSSQVLFANNVILTEGKTELRLLPYIYKKIIQKTLGQSQIAMIETGSVNNINKTLQILEAMDIPSKAVVDLDYAFRGAISNRLISADDADIIALKAILNTMENNGECTLSGGLPTKSPTGVTAAMAFEIMASKPGANVYINSLAGKLLNNNIWLWTKGAIEAHLGLTEKDEAAWSSFKNQCEEDELHLVCHDYQSISNLIHWVSA